jgi:hypothetical protein
MSASVQNERWGLLDQVCGGYFLSVTTAILYNAIAIIMCDWNPFKFSLQENLLMMLVISPALLCLFLVGYHMYKKIFWPLPVAAGLLIAIRMHNLHS